MLKVKTILKCSEIHGIGVFADEPIAKGRMVIRDDSDLDIFIPEKVLNKLPVPMKESIIYYGTYNKKKAYYSYCIDNEKFMNHSDNANIRSGRNVMFAVRDIKKGEELTVDYYEFCDDCIKDGLNETFKKGTAFVEGDQKRMSK